MTSQKPGVRSFLIATHSPIILAYPGAVLFSLDGDAIEEIAYRDSKHYPQHARLHELYPNVSSSTCSPKPTEAFRTNRHDR